MKGIGWELPSQLLDGESRLMGTGVVGPLEPSTTTAMSFSTV